MEGNTPGVPEIPEQEFRQRLGEIVGDMGAGLLNASHSIYTACAARFKSEIIEDWIEDHTEE